MFLFPLLIMVISGCGYNLRGDSREFFDQHQIKTLYISPVRNNSYKAGIEITLYNALRKKMSQGGYLRIVDEEKNADAILAVTVSQADYVTLSPVPAISLAPQPTPAPAGVAAGPLLTNPNVYVASVYNANLKARFALVNKFGVQLFAQETPLLRPFSSSTYQGVTGDTSALINESEFERALNDLSVSMVTNFEGLINSYY